MALEEVSAATVLIACDGLRLAVDEEEGADLGFGGYGAAGDDFEAWGGGEGGYGDEADVGSFRVGDVVWWER